MKLPNEPEKRKIIAEKIIYEIATDQLKVSFKNIEPYSKEFLKNTIDYFDALSRQVFDTFICEFGFAMSKEDYFNSILFLHENIYKFFVRSFVKDIRIKKWLDDKRIKDEDKNNILNVAENSLFLFLCNNLFEIKSNLNSKIDDKELNGQLEKFACIIAIMMRIDIKFISIYDNAIKAECEKIIKTAKEVMGNSLTEKGCEEMRNNNYNFYVNLMGKNA